ncbi:DUF58 domain-containing protein [Allorhizocola rhizosphaerae]|uniref:DUF58 domain-containing protein n=1 Tax=Allorhizocola rhizosphaerae TaxID=1872709 RepID=UPI000E3E1214|nr:DUF58 domain-containing protein [Allorhizocola rhizosphaerae]
MIRPTARGVAVAVLAATALGLGWWWRYPGLIAVGAGFAVLLLSAFASVAARVDVTARRSVEPLQVERFGRCTDAVELVHNGRRFAVTVDAVESVGGEQVPVLSTTLRPRGSAESRIDVPTSRRGTITVGPLKLRRLGIAGLTRAEWEEAGVVKVRVLPRVLPLHGIPVGSTRWVAGSDERIARGGTDIVGMRDYLPGDDLRRLHWATSARVGRLMVREDADPSRGRVTLLLDDRASAYASPADFEEAVDAAASIAGAASAAGHPVAVRTASGVIWAEQADEEEALALLGDAVLAEGTLVFDRPDAHDVLVILGGAGSDAGELGLAAGQATSVIALLVCSGPPESDGLVPVVRGANAEELLRGWEEQV